MRTIEDFQDADTDEWRIEWDDNEPSERVTTLAAVAWCGTVYDDSADVYRCTDGD